MLCKHCNAPLNSKYKVFCNSSCAAKYNNTHREPRTEESRKKTGESVRNAAAIESSVVKERRRLNCLRTLLIRKPRDFTKFPMSEEGKLRVAKANTGKIVSEVTRRKLSAAAIKNNLGGHTSKKKMSYLTKSGVIVYLQSSYEIRLAVILDDLGIDWVRPPPMLWVDSENKEHRYYADFKIGEIFLDTKNDYLAVKDAEKISKVIEQNSVTVLIILKEHLTKDYISSIAG